MADRQVKAILAVDYQGEQDVLKAQSDLREVDDAARGAGDGLETTSTGFSKAATAAVGIGAGLAIAKVGFQALGDAAQAAWGQIERGAELQLQAQQFDSLAASIGTTADALRNDLGEATNGLQSQAEQISGASQLISLGLAKTHEEAVALSEVSGKLNWDMQVLGLTIANQSTARLDSLGLSIESVKDKMGELTAQGMSTDEAFKWAIIEAGRDKIEVIGDVSETAVGKIQKLAASGQDLKDSFSGLAFTLFEAAGGVEAVGNAAGNLNLLGDALAKIEQYKDAGLDIEKLIKALASGNWDDVKTQVTSLDNQLQLNDISWREWAFAVENGIYTTGQLSFALGSADDAMLAQAQRVMDAKQEMEAYGYTAYTAALAQQNMADVDLSALSTQYDAAREAIDAYTVAIEQLGSRGGDYFTQFSETGPDGESTYDYADALYATADAYGANLGVLKDIGVEYGKVSEAQADAATDAAQNQVIMDAIAQSAADGVIPWENYADAVKTAIEALNGVPNREAVPIPDVADRGRRAGADEFSQEQVNQYEPIPLEVELQTQAIEDAVTQARGIVEGFTSPAEAYEAVMAMDIGDVETKASRATELINGIPTHKEVFISVTAQGMAILEELRSVGAIP